MKRKQAPEVIVNSDPFIKEEEKVKKVSEAEFIQQQHLEKQNLNQAIKFFMLHSYKDIFRRKFHFLLAFCSVFLVVVSTLVINQIISKGSIIFLKIAESTHGEIDAFVTPSADIVAKTLDGIEIEIPALLNYTAVNEHYKKHDPKVLDDLLLAPRKVFTGVKVVKQSRSGLYNETSSIQMERWRNSFDPKYNLPIRSDTSNIKFANNLNDYTLVAFMTDREKEIQIGREYNFEPMKVGECKLVNDKDGQAQLDGIKQGQIIFMKIGPINLMPFVNQFEKSGGKPILTNTGLPERQLRQLERQLIDMYVQVPCRVSLAEERYGKVPKTLSNVIFMEYDNLLTLLAEYLPETLDSNLDFKNFFRKKNLLEEFADQLLLQLPKPRSSHYLKQFDKVMQTIQAHMAFAEEKLGFFPINVEAFILQDFKLAHLSVTFLQLIFNLVMLLLFSISVLLIYSLLMLSVESKSFEFGVMRMVGLSKHHIIFLVIFQAFLFVIPSIATGFLASYSFLQIAKIYAETTLQMEFEAIPSTASVLQALILSTLIPLLSSILPIQVVLDRNLNDALDIQRSKTQAVFVNILNKKKANLTPMVLFGLAITIYGVTIYYLLPLALLSMNLSLVSQIIIFILVGLLFALTLLAFNIQNIIERICTNLFLFFEVDSIRAMVIKNLSAHRRRNQMTGLIYSLSLGFLIFLSISCRMQINVSSREQLKEKASYFLVKFDEPSNNHILVLEQIMAKNDHIIDKFSWVTAPLHNFQQAHVTKATLNDLQARTEMDQDLHGIMPNYFETTISDFSTQFQDYEGEDQYLYGVPFTSQLSLGEQLYTPRGSQGTLMMAYAWQKHRSRVLRTQEQIDSSETGEAVLMLTLYSEMQKTVQYIRPIAFMENCAGFNMLFLQGRRFSKQSMLSSLPVWSKFSRLGMDNIPMIRLHILLKEPFNKEHIKFLKESITSSLDKTGFKDKYEIWSYIDLLENTGQAEFTLETIFSVVIVVTMFICFFSLSSSMTGNLYEQCKEISVMRAIGFTKNVISKLYIYEAFILVIASSFSGVMIGTVVGWSISFQRSMFINMPTPFVFPAREFLFIFTVSIACAFFSTYSPSRQLMAKSIPDIAKAY